MNTGHSWQFTPTHMGEPGARIDPRIDGNENLRWMRYEDAPTAWREIRLGQAVAASSCVPGLFGPLELRGLFPERVVRLVDGGVHDNQGVGGLLDRDCNVLLVSDASGQMQTLTDPPGGAVRVPLRANSILQARVRAAQYQELEARRRSSLLRGLLFLHLRKDLDVDPVDWVGCPEPWAVADEIVRPESHRGTVTSYGVPKQVQEKLAAIRTDLDSFSDLEAFSLMTSGYRMAESEARKSLTAFSEPAAERPDWRFLNVEKIMSPRNPDFPRLLRVLGLAERPALSAGLKWFAILLLAYGMGLLLLRNQLSPWTWIIGYAGLLLALLVAMPLLILSDHRRWLRTGRFSTESDMEREADEGRV